jgi:hypothetical protein
MYNDKYNSIGSSQSIVPEDSIEILLQDWYVFAEGKNELTGINQTNNFYQIMERIFDNNYSTTRKPRFTFNVGYCVNNSTFTLKKDLPVKYSVDLNYKQGAYYNPVVDINSSLPQIIGAVGYKIFIKDYLSFLSYINIQFMVSVSTGKGKTEQTTVNNHASIIYGVYNSYNEYLKWENTLNILNSYTARVSVPVLVLGHSLFCELSLNAGLLEYSSSTTYLFNMKNMEGFNVGTTDAPHYEIYQIAEGNGNGTVEAKGNYFVIYPTIDISYETESGVRISASGSYNYFALLSGFSF